MTPEKLLFEMELPIKPVAKERPRVTKWGTYTPKTTRLFERTVSILIRQAMRVQEPFQYPIGVYCEFHLKKPIKPKFDLPGVQPDIDNYMKALLDGASKVLFKNDGQVCEIHAKKLYAIGEPKIILKVFELKNS